MISDHHLTEWSVEYRSSKYTTLLHEIIGEWELTTIIAYC